VCARNDVVAPRDDANVTTTHFTTVRVIACRDSRDQPAGEVTPFGVAFDLEGPAGRVNWSLNTGWVDRPVITERLQTGVQERSDRPGVDPLLAREFPKPIDVHVMPAGAVEVEDGWPVRGMADELLRTMVRDGQEAVFAILKSVYNDHLATS